MKITDFKIILIVLLIPLLTFSQIRSQDSLTLAQVNTRYDNAMTTAVQDSTAALRTNVDPNNEAGYRSIKITPANKDIALKTFLQTAALNFGSETQVNKDVLSSHIPVFAVMEYDGLSLNVYQQYQNDKNEKLTERKWLPKKPFSYTDNQGNTINFTVSDEVEVYVKALDQWFYGKRAEVINAIAEVYEIEPPEEIKPAENLLSRVPLELLERIKAALTEELYEELETTLKQLQTSTLFPDDLVDRLVEAMGYDLWSELEEAIQDFDNGIEVPDGDGEDGNGDGNDGDNATEGGSEGDNSNTDSGDGDTPEGNLPDVKPPASCEDSACEEDIVVEVDPDGEVENADDKQNLYKYISTDLDERLKKALSKEVYNNLVKALNQYKEDTEIPAPILDSVANSVPDELFVEFLFALSNASEKTQSIKKVSNPLATLVSEKERNPLDINLSRLTHKSVPLDEETRPTVSLLQNEELFDDIRRKTIVSTMENQFAYYINIHNVYKEQLDVTYKFVLPTINKEDWYNTVDDIGVFVFIQGYKIERLNNYYNQHAFSGARIAKKDAIYGADEDGKKVYYRASCNFNLKADIAFSSRKEAASKGYIEKSCLNATP